MKYFLTRWIVLPTTVLFTIFLSTACLGNTTGSTEETAQTTVSSSTSSASTSTASTGTAITDITANYSQKDLNDSWDDSTSTHVTLSENSITADQSSGLSIDGSTITITAAGTYIVSGKLTDGQIVVEAGDTADVQIVLNNATIANSTTSPIYVKQADKTIITLPTGTVNAIADTSNYTFLEGEDEPDATIFSKNDLTINGSGKLTVAANYRNGIASKDDLVITGGTIEVTAVNDALRGRDSVSVKDGTLTLTAGGDGIKANQDADATKGWICLDGGNYTITAENDAIQAETILKINDGTYTIKTGGGSENAAAKTPSANEGMGMGHKNGGTPPTMDGTAPDAGTTPPAKEIPAPEAIPQTATTTDTATQESYKGFKAGTQLIINNGTFLMNTNDDALHTNGNLTIAGGTFTISTGDDAVHADGDTLISDGTIQIDKSYEGIEGATVTINGGNIKLTASDDGINAAGGSDGNVGMDSFRSGGNNSIRITGGNVTVDAAGDGIDANGTIYIDGGTTLINGPTSGGDSAVDFDGSFIISGGTLVGAGTAGMAQSASNDSTQNSIMISYPQTQAAGTAIQLTDASGNAAISFSPTKDYQSVLISAPALIKGSTYTLNSNGTKLSDITLENIVTTVSSDGSAVTNTMRQGGGGGGRGGQRPENGQTKAAPSSEENSTAQ